MAGAEPEAEGSGEGGGGGGRAPPSRGGSAVRVAPLGPEQLRRVLERVTKAQPPAKPPPPPPPPPFVLQDAAQQAALQRGPDAEPPRQPRLLPPQQLEAICVRVTPGETEGQERPSPLPQPAATQPRTARPSPLPGRHCGVLGPRVTSPQLLGPRPLLSAQPQPRVPNGSPQPPVWVLAPRPLPALRPVPAKRAVAPPAPNGSGATPAPRSASDALAVTPVSSSSANLFVSNLYMKHTERLKKSLKVKTRSGRISRPPKYKARDYKFIKMEDLADGHPSDSDDYAELSVDEEEEQQQEKRALFDLSSCPLQPRAFRCQTCAKSYIGKGGLARHFRLNPGHGPPQPEMSPSGKASGSVTPGLPSAQGGLQNGQSEEVEEASVSEPADGSYSALLGTERHPGPTRGCAAAPAEPSAAALQRSSAARSGASLQEFLRQCDRQDLVEWALPQLAQVVTVHEFLLMKVEKDHRAKPFFPAVYKEFEELHKMVKKMCQDYLHSSGPRSQEPLEINSSEVAESLGITEGFLRKSGTPTGGNPHPRSSHGTAGAGPEAAIPRKRESETAEAGLASAKRTRRAALPTEPTASSADSGGRPRPARGAPEASEGSAPRVTRSACLDSEEGHTTPLSDRDRSASRAGGQLKALADCAARSGSADPAPSHQSVSEPGLHTQMGQPGPPTLEQAVAFPTENAQGHSSDLHAGDSLGSWGLCSSLMSEGGVASLLPGRSGHSGAGKLGQMPGSRVSGQPDSTGKTLPAGAEAPLLGGVLSGALCTEHPSRPSPRHCVCAAVSRQRVRRWGKNCPAAPCVAGSAGGSGGAATDFLDTCSRACGAPAGLTAAARVCALSAKGSVRRAPNTEMDGSQRHRHCAAPTDVTLPQKLHGPVPSSSKTPVYRAREAPRFRRSSEEALDRHRVPTARGAAQRAAPGLRGGPVFPALTVAPRPGPAAAPRQAPEAAGPPPSPGPGVRTDEQEGGVVGVGL